MSPRVVPDPRPAMVLGVGGFAVLLTAACATGFVVASWVCSRIWPDTGQTEGQQ